VRPIFTFLPIRLASMRPSTCAMAEPSEHDRVLDLAILDAAAVADRRVRPDVRVRDARVASDDGGTAHDGARRSRAFLDHDFAFDVLSPSDFPAMSYSNVSSTVRLASSMSSSLPVSFHHPTRCADGRVAVVDQVLDRVGDLELAAEARLDALDRVRRSAGPNM
jgi:hypothetical protein